MDLEIALVFIATLLVAVYTTGLLLQVALCVAILLLGVVFAPQLMFPEGLVSMLFAFCIGAGIVAWDELAKKYYMEDLLEQYQRLLRMAPDFTEVNCENPHEALFLVTDGEFAAYAFYYHIYGKNNSTCVYADLLDNPMENLEQTPESLELGDLLFTLHMMRKELGIEA